MDIEKIRSYAELIVKVGANVQPGQDAWIVADVADKGIAAALYMMMSKMVLDNKLTVCHTPGQVLEDVNRQLYKKSMKGMFVTVWLGILDLETGDLVSAAAIMMA